VALEFSKLDPGEVILSAGKVLLSMLALPRDSENFLVSLVSVGLSGFLLLFEPTGPTGWLRLPRVGLRLPREDLRLPWAWLQGVRRPRVSLRFRGTRLRLP
jgi:hypothetical protein